MVNADQYCDNLYKNFTEKCTPSMVTIKSCCELKIFTTNYAPSGVYKMSKGSFDNSVDAYCDMTSDGGGWIVIQRNKKNSLVNFNKNWTDYEQGFGDLTTEFWYGLEPIHCLTQRGQWEMRTDYQFNNKSWTYIHYTHFQVKSASEKYQLNVGGFTGIGIDDFTYSDKANFSTPDKDNDSDGGNCAISYRSGWWYKSCYRINPNTQPPTAFNGPSVLFSEMKIRPKDCIIQ